MSVRYAGRCYGENRHWHLSMNGRWTYHANIDCPDCQNADQKYNIERTQNEKKEAKATG